jgi:hypothetical protein
MDDFVHKNSLTLWGLDCGNQTPILVNIVKYNSKQFSKKVLKRIARHKRVRYHNDAALFPDDTATVDRKRRASVKSTSRKKDSTELYSS